MRGTALRKYGAAMVQRFIPARAGNGPKSAISLCPYSVHPRACGERLDIVSREMIGFGSSPRVRGTVVRGSGDSIGRRFIPARAGNGFSGTPRFATMTVHPRACGERNATPATKIRAVGSSPRVRGTVKQQARDREWERFIPARAGNGMSGPPDFGA